MSDSDEETPISEVAEAAALALQAAYEARRVSAKEAKLSCAQCKKPESSDLNLQACSRCRSVRYCSRDCQTLHYKNTHKHDCTTFKHPPICRAFNPASRLPGCAYPETPMIGRGYGGGMGAWVSVSGSGSCRLKSLVPGLDPLDPEDHDSLMEDMDPDVTKIFRTTKDKILSLTILVQNRSPKGQAIDVWSKAMTAVGTLAGTPVLLEGETEYEQNTMVFHPIHGPESVVGLMAINEDLTHFNGKFIEEEEDRENHPALVDDHTGALVLKVGEYAIFTVKFRIGGPNITHEFQALELLEAISIPYTTHGSNSADDPEHAEIHAYINRLLSRPGTMITKQSTFVCGA